ncbi:MAG: acetolactate synthase small subunit [Mariniblastus sp.]|nr:acetolactate synthase small subunit [Mariniblastus sp.]
MSKENFTFAVFSENKAGLLQRVVSGFTRRKINIESLTVSESEVPGIHRYTIVVEGLDEALVKKVCTALEKQVDVQKAFYYRESDIIYREIAMYKVRAESMKEGSPGLAIVDKHHARILSVEEGFTVIQKTGRREATQALFVELEPHGILEFVRSGRIAISRPMKQLKTYLDELALASTH